jgi:hypothetical protein
MALSSLELHSNSFSRLIPRLDLKGQHFLLVKEVPHLVLQDLLNLQHLPMEVVTE